MTTISLVKKTLVVLIVVLIATMTYFSRDIVLTLNTGAGFAAKNLCSGYHNSGYEFAALKQQALVPVNPLFQLISYDYDAEQKRVTASVAGMFERQAQFRSGIGCTLLGLGQTSLEGSIVATDLPSSSATLPWPEGLGDPVRLSGIDHGQLETVVAAAFAEPDEDFKRQTKAVLVVHQGELVAERYAAPLDREVPALSWSMAKSVTNLMVGSLVNRNKLAISDRVPFKSWQAEDDPRAQITIDNMLRMSSGLEFNETYGINTDVTHMLSNEISAADFAMDKPLAFPIDSHWAYASGTSNMLARIVYDTIGGTLQDKYDYFREALFDPLGIRQAIVEHDGSNVFIGSSYFYTTARDWAKLGQLMLQDGVWNDQRLLPEGWAEYSTTPTPAAAKADYGAHFWLNGQPEGWEHPSIWPELPNDIYFMSGYQGQFVVVVPSEETVIVRLGYTYPGTDEGMQALIGGVIKALGGN